MISMYNQGSLCDHDLMFQQNLRKIKKMISNDPYLKIFIPKYPYV